MTGHIYQTILVRIFIVFSYTFERVQENSEKLWWYERYTAINDYQWRKPSPINLGFIPYRIYMKCKKKGYCSQRGKRMYYIQGLDLLYNETKIAINLKDYHLNIPRINRIQFSRQLKLTNFTSVSMNFSVRLLSSVCRSYGRQNVHHSVHF